MKILVVLISLVMFAGCAQQPNTYVAVPVTPQQQQQVEAINDGGNNIVSRACTNGQGYVVEDKYCDPQWIAQQQILAQQNHDNQMLQDLLLYHFMFGGNVGVGNVYLGGVRTMPYGYGYLPYRDYNYARVHRHVTINKTYVTVNNPTVQRNSPSPNFSSRSNTSTSSSVQTRPSTSFSSRPSTSFSKPSFSTKPSFSKSVTPSFSRRK